MCTCSAARRCRSQWDLYALVLWGHRRLISRTGAGAVARALRILGEGLAGIGAGAAWEPGSQNEGAG